MIFYTNNVPDPCGLFYDYRMIQVDTTLLLEIILNSITEVIEIENYYNQSIKNDCLFNLMLRKTLFKVCIINCKIPNSLKTIY